MNTARTAPQTARPTRPETDMPDASTPAPADAGTTSREDLLRAGAQLHGAILRYAQALMPTFQRYADEVAVYAQQLEAAGLLEPGHTPEPETVHASPLGAGRTPCCGLTPLEVPAAEPLTTRPGLVTCLTADELAAALDEATPPDMHLTADFRRAVAARLLAMIRASKRPGHPVWQPAPAPDVEEPSLFPPAPDGGDDPGQTITTDGHPATGPATPEGLEVLGGLIHAVHQQAPEEAAPDHATVAIRGVVHLGAGLAAQRAAAARTAPDQDEPRPAGAPKGTDQ